MKILTKLIILFLLFLLLIVIPFQLTHLYLNLKDKADTGQVAGLESQQQAVKVTAFVGEYHFTLFGYTSPFALVTFDGQGIYDKTTADETGYFIFNNRFSPFSSHEACLSVKDQFGRLSSPLCLPPFPVNYNVNIGPVIMPPTISLDKNDYFMGDEVILSGQAVPNTEVNLSVFGDTGNLNFALIKPVEAFSFPQLNAITDSKGNFSINLPSSNPEKFRLFAQTDFEKSISPNSIHLNFEILPVWMIIIFLIRPRLLEITIIAEIILILGLLKGYFKKKTMVLYQSHLPAIEEEKSLIKY